MKEKKPKLNRIKEVLRRRKRTNTWLAEQLGYNINTISRWCHNKQQPDVTTLYKVAHLLEVPVYDLLEPENPFDDQAG